MTEFNIMTREEIEQINWDVERSRLMRPRWSKMIADFMMGGFFAMIMIFAFWCAWDISEECRREDERTAYLMGLWSCDEKTARSAAKQGVGYCAEQYLKEKGW